MDLKVNKIKIGSTQRKILALLAAGFAFGATRSVKKQIKIITEELPAEFSKIRHQSLEYGLHRLYSNKYIKMESLGDGKYIPYLTEEGKNIANIYSLDEINIPTPKTWDGYWRIVLFDIPEKLKKRRELFRYHLKRLGFREVQKSVFCFPYECGEQIMEITEDCKISQHVSYMVAKEISEGEKFRSFFSL